ncbi:MFS transporter [Comamonas sp. Y33R10-2]|uniref:YbfB/YjiJ family MFS transporter n=1 Tax=Comamonas sp. Y33R10-2 TaxID=2853257 RepID=UPI001C5CAE22|nr:YbfB/YjiJ family MFS transporter [Comamonas sp. Y33R10-2]QXZ08848.1 MFS transporter [Comamonas sp. Y33R10-2]
MIQRQEIPLLLTGFMATLSGVGLARFAYTALMPQMVHAGWFNGEQVAYLGAANLLGYLIGALAAAPLAERLGSVRMLVMCWVVVMLSFAACSLPQPMELFFVWRVMAGIAGAALMVLGPSVAMSATAPQRRAALGPLMFCGIGAGALLAATLVPMFAHASLSAVWWALTGLCALALWFGWRAARQIVPHTAKANNSAAPAEPHRPLWSAAVILLFFAYTCDAFGFVPHTVFWVDYLDRELLLGASYASMQWAFFGLGATLGPLCAAYCAARWGWRGATTGAYAIKAVAIGLPLVWGGFAGHAISGFVVGALSPGMAAIISGYLMQLIGPAQHKKMWGYATAAFALLQASAGYLMAFIYAQTGSYRSLFVLGFTALALGSALVVCIRFVRSNPGSNAGRSASS